MIASGSLTSRDISLYASPLLDKVLLALDLKVLPTFYPCTTIDGWALLPKLAIIMVMEREGVESKVEAQEYVSRLQ